MAKITLFPLGSVSVAQPGQPGEPPTARRGFAYPIDDYSPLRSLGVMPTARAMAANLAMPIMCS